MTEIIQMRNISRRSAPVGYADDLSVVIFALVRVALYVDDEIKMQAKNKLKDLFGENVDTTEIDNKLGR